MLDLRVPAWDAIHTDGDLWRALGTLVPRFVPYSMSFLALGIVWVGQQTQRSHLDRGDRNLAGIHPVFLLDVSLRPSSTTLVAAFITYRIALAVYWLNILLLGAALFARWWCA